MAPEPAGVLKPDTVLESQLPALAQFWPVFVMNNAGAGFEVRNADPCVIQQIRVGVGVGSLRIRSPDHMVQGIGDMFYLLFIFEQTGLGLRQAGDIHKYDNDAGSRAIFAVIGTDLAVQHVPHRREYLLALVYFATLHATDHFMQVIVLNQRSQHLDRLADMFGFYIEQPCGCWCIKAQAELLVGKNYGRVCCRNEILDVRR